MKKNTILIKKMFRRFKWKFKFYSIKIMECICYKEYFDSNFKYISINNSLYKQFKFNGKIDNWNLDKKSSYIFPQKKYIDIKTNIEIFFDKCIDIKYPWDKSRLHELLHLPISKSGYNGFKKILKDWIKNNPFLHGVNWVCTMDVGIRIANIVTSLGKYSEFIENDHNFKKIISKLLIQHGYYIERNLEIGLNDHTTNHTDANFVGLLFIASAMKESRLRSKWLNIAMSGLEDCIDYQIDSNGIDFEGSIPYHRLVLEFFLFSAILVKILGLNFSKNYYNKLFKMLKFTAFYLDHNGYAPQIGDNDSGRLFKFNQLDEHYHGYLISLGEIVFEYKFNSLYKKRLNKLILNNISKELISDSYSIKYSKLWHLNNQNMSIIINGLSIDPKGSGGHNHDDISSWTLSVNGEEVVVDPGTYNYTRSIAERNLFRSKNYHNVCILLDEKDSISDSIQNIWKLNHSVEIKQYYFSNNNLNLFLTNNIERKFILKSSYFIIIDKSELGFISKIHLHPKTLITKNEGNKILLNINSNFIEIEFFNSNLIIENYSYSPRYDYKVDAKCLKFKVIKVSKSLNITIKYLGRE